MPAARLLGRRWMFATDDLVFPCILEIPYRFIWFVLMILVIKDSGPFPCYDSAYAKFFAGGTLTLQLLMMVVLVATAHQSARGSFTEVDKRKYVGPLLICKLFLLLVEIGLNLMGVVWIFFGAALCRVTPFSKTLLECILILSWIPLLLIGLAVYIAYDPLGTLEYAELQTEEEKEFYHKKFTQIMAGRVQWTFWFFRDNKMKEAVMEMASLLSILFRSTDLVLYDLIAGSILLRVRQKRETRSLRESQSQVDMAEIDYTTDMRKITEEVPPWMTMEEALHYLKFATAAYGGVFVLYRYYCAGFCFLIPYLRCCCWRPQHVMGDNCCMCNYAGLKYISQITDKDFIYVSYENHIFEVPFYVLAEHSRKRIVVTVRGSLTLHDMFTDLAGAAQKFEAEGLPPDSLAHKGMILGTEKTLERLTPILESAFEEYPDYELVITGHSLGAAVSTLLGIKLKSKYPHLKVFAFSTPSGLLTREAARYTESFVLTVGVGDDVVMRLSVTSAQMFRDRLIETMHMTRLPKYRILLKGLQYMFFKIPDSDLTSIWKPTDDLEADLVGPPRRLVRSISYDLEKLYVGGRILHIVPHKPALTNRIVLKSESKYKMRWANPEEFIELTVTPSMLSDHMPQNIEGPLRHIVEALSRSATVPLSTPDTP